MYKNEIRRFGDLIVIFYFKAMLNLPLEAPAILETSLSSLLMPHFPIGFVLLLLSLLFFSLFIFFTSFYFVQLQDQSLTKLLAFIIVSCR